MFMPCCFIAPFLNAANPLLARYILVSLDATLWPSNSTWLHQAVQLAANVLHMSANNIGHLQLPMAHQATDNETVMKHCRIVEDKVVFHQLDMNAMTLLFKKDESARSNDKRKTTQLCKTLSSKHFKSSDGVWATSKACESGYIGNLPLVRVADMLGYDETNKPNPGARVEQTLLLGSGYFSDIF